MRCFRWGDGEKRYLGRIGAVRSERREVVVNHVFAGFRPRTNALELWPRAFVQMPALLAQLVNGAFGIA